MDPFRAVPLPLHRRVERVAVGRLAPGLPLHQADGLTVDEGLGACFFGVPGERVAGFREAFGVPPEYRPVGCVSVGYPGSEDRRSPSLRRGRRGLDEVVHRGRW
ncbi:hypothetical protein [Blastococcus sp. CT_GayMR20]|uniref:nitroreductase family protein n=1 Tax=Blastococcus sp. CT_GayMR20 TaxID=2559609 RepID=UPI001FD75854|nr:hypothetical protein [Blastococcus sp. CT_GayMR20]